jgi:hypothetical protein
MAKQPDLFGGETFGIEDQYFSWGPLGRRRFIDQKMQAILEIYGWAAVWAYVHGSYDFVDEPTERRAAFRMIEGGKT